MSRNSRFRNGEEQLLRSLYGRVDAYEQNNAEDAPMMQTAVAQQGATMSPMRGNPAFDAQFDLQILIKYFTVAAGAYTGRTAAYLLANAATLATVLAFFLFGNADFQGGYKFARGQFPLTLWTAENPFVYGGSGYPATSFGVLDATALAQLQIGDMVLPYTNIQAGPVNYTALVIIRCVNVSYGTLLASTNSDRFILNRIRYIQNDTSAAGLAQYTNAIYWFKQTLFGKTDKDSITPNSQKPPDQFQAGVIDVPITKEINKESIFGSYIDYDAVAIQWSIFVKTVQKLHA